MTNWHYLIGSEQLGPISEDEIVRLLQIGEITQDTLVWMQGMPGWEPVSAVRSLSRSAPMPPQSTRGSRREQSLAIATTPTSSQSVQVDRISESTLADPSEATAFVLVCVAAGIPLLVALVYVVATLGLALVFVGIYFVSMLLRHALAFAYYRANAVQVGPDQFPEIHALASRFAMRLGRSLPEIYVVQDSIFNAFAMRLLGTPVVVLNSATIDSILLNGDHKRLAFIVGHELGHHYAGHLGWKRFFAGWGAWCVWARFWYSRRCEFTCDRYGLACAGDIASAQRAICHMAVGAQLADQVNLEEAARQWSSRRNEFFVRYRALYSTHPHTLDRLAQLPAAADSLGMAG